MSVDTVASRAAIAATTTLSSVGRRGDTATLAGSGFSGLPASGAAAPSLQSCWRVHCGCGPHSQGLNALPKPDPAARVVSGVAAYHPPFETAKIKVRLLRLTAPGLGIVMACVTPPENPFPTFQVPVEDLDLRGKRIALVPLLVPREIEDPEPLITRFDSIIESLLRANEINLVPSAEYRRVWDRINQEAGGFYDPFTGIRDDERYDAAVKRLLVEVRDRFEVAAFLYPELWVVEAAVNGSVAEWDGTAERLVATPESGFVLAMSFAVAVEGVDGSAIYENGKGLMVMEELDLESQLFVPIPRDRLFEDWGDIDHIVSAVLGPLIDVLKPDSSGVDP